MSTKAKSKQKLVPMTREPLCSASCALLWPCEGDQRNSYPCGPFQQRYPAACACWGLPFRVLILAVSIYRILARSDRQLQAGMTEGAGGRLQIVRLCFSLQHRSSLSVGCYRSGQLARSCRCGAKRPKLKSAFISILGLRLAIRPGVSLPPGKSFQLALP